MMVLFLVGLVSMILLRTLRKDYARYGKDDELDDMVKYKQTNLLFKKKTLLSKPTITVNGIDRDEP